MKIELLSKSLLKIPCDLLILGHFSGVKRLNESAQRVDEALEGAISQLIEQDEFEAKFGQILLFPTFGKIASKKVAIIGLGEKKSLTVDALRKIGGHLVKLAERAHADRIVTSLHGVDVNEIDAFQSAHALTEGALLSEYRFHAFHGTKRQAEKKPKQLTTLTFCDEEVKNVKRAKEGIERAEILAKATNVARDLVNTPSSHMGPAQLAAEAQKIVGKNIEIKTLDAAEMEKLGMHAALAVGRGSSHAPIGVHLSYVPRGAKKKIAIVGKAVTFDSGGLSLKPADGMMTMKIDMAGAATVIGLFHALADLKLPVEVHGIFLAVENMPNGNAYRPGDVVTAMNGMTIEVLNTDAEGRVTLADALCYAVQQQPDVIIDLATLTGAIVGALGEEIAGLFSSNAKLAERLKNASLETGEMLWEMPLFEGYTDHIKSKIADIKNIGQRGSAGSISAALFLKPFVNDIPWAHLDIAGTCYTEKESRPDQPYGASGYGVRLLVEYLERL
jgi:leucyl aminopeptidase